MEKYCDTNLNYYIKIKLTEEGRIIYQKHYAKYNCEAPKLNIDDEGYVKFQIHNFMKIFGEHLFMGATLPCETNCKIQVKDEWHYVKDGDLPKDTTVLYLVRVYSWDFGFSHLYKKNGTYIPTVCEWNGEYFKALDSMAYSNARNIKSCFAWKEIVLPKESE